MHRKDNGHDSYRRRTSSDSDTKTNVRQATRTATAAAALATLGLTGIGAAHADVHTNPPAPARDETRPDGPVRTVMPGDSLWSVATANGLSVDELMEYNNLHGDALLIPGKHLRLSPPPAPETPSPTVNAGETEQLPAPPAPTEPKNNHIKKRYTVISGDSLWNIAATHQVTVADIVEANNLDLASGLKAGQNLIIPGTEQSPAPADKTPQESPKVTNNFPGYTYDDHTLAAANKSQQELEKVPSISPAELQRMIRTTAEEMGVDPALALAHAEQESGFNHHVVSPAHAIGTMQVIPSAGQWAETLVGRPLNLLDPQDNITAGVAIIRANTQRADNRNQAIAAYYQGLYGVQEYGMFDDTKRYVAEVNSKLSRWS